MAPLEESLLVSARVSVALLLFLAAASKIRDLEAFRRGVAAFDLLPLWALAPFAVGVPVAEATAGAAILLPATSGLGAVLAGAIFTVFAVAVIAAVARKARIPCHCFDAEELAGPWTLIRLGIVSFLCLVSQTGALNTYRLELLAPSVLIGSPSIHRWTWIGPRSSCILWTQKRASSRQWASDQSREAGKCPRRA